ncbi:hypothetical protein MPER_01075 [Moniliophthora perniciosa FA553]|nr:hypothetical protein MPER_01075 [Moniliophthora perniciosa FA553]
MQLFERAEGQRAMLARNRVKNLAEKASAAMDRYLSSSFHKSRCKPDMPNTNSVNPGAPLPGAAATSASSARFPESYIRRGPEEWLVTGSREMDWKYRNFSVCISISFPRLQSSKSARSWSSVISSTESAGNIRLVGSILFFHNALFWIWIRSV